jgi:quercetin dioxygenase-like cupin family protein
MWPQRRAQPRNHFAGTATAARPDVPYRCAGTPQLLDITLRISNGPQHGRQITNQMGRQATMPDTHHAAVEQPQPTSGLAAKIVTPNQAKSICAFGIPMTIMLRAEETGGAFAALVAKFEPGQGPPPHFHHDHEEFFFVLEGEFEITVGDQTATAGPGAMVFVPRETVHAFKYVGSTQGKMLEWGLPGGQERYFEAIDQLAAKGELNPDSVVATSRDFATEFVG